MSSTACHTVLLSLSLLLACSAMPASELRASGDDGSQAVLDALDASSERYARLARELWKLAELGYQEEESCALLVGELERSGFTVQRGVAGMPTAFVATFGSGEPVLGVLGEYDALPGMSQAAEPRMGPARETAEEAPGALIEALRRFRKTCAALREASPKR